MLLAIDAGNTKTKWAFFNAQGEIFGINACLNTSINDAFIELDMVSSVIISNVAGDRHAAVIKQKLSKPDLDVQWLKSTAHCCHVKNRYMQPETLGSDRWAAMIAAWHTQHAPCVIVNAGTAVTIDALLPYKNQVTDAEFIGGMILPGLNLMQSSLSGATAQLAFAVHGSSDQISPFNTNTADAMRHGALSAICGAIQYTLNTMIKDYQTKAIVLVSGGDAEVIKKHLDVIVTNQVIMVDNLVLYGLYFIHRNQHPTK